MQSLQPRWNRCTIWHDEFLNDVDDLAANALATKAARAEPLLHQNYISLAKAQEQAGAADRQQEAGEESAGSASGPGSASSI